MTSPAITVSLPIYNAERFLEPCLRSLHAQTFADFEVMAVLDGCTDRSEEILMDLKDDRFMVFKHEHSEGAIAGLNLALDRARALLITRIDADDFMEPQRFARQLDVMASEPEITVLGTWFDYVNEQGRLLRKAFPFPTGHDEIKQGFRVRNSIGGPTAFCRTETMRELGGYLPDFPNGEDLALWLRCLAAGFRLANLPEVLYHYRVHGVQQSTARRAKTIQCSNLAYARYGPLIWGPEAPLVQFGLPLHRRIARRIGRALRGEKP